MLKIALYYHGGSKNHGCEAIVRSTLQMLKGHKIKLFTFSIGEDKLFGLDKEVELCQLGPENTHAKVRLHGIKKLLPLNVLRALAKVKNKFIAPPPAPNYAQLYAPLLQEEADVFISIGGDNYCYASHAGLTFINKQLNAQGKKTVLWGCSVEPEDIKNSAALREDLKLYSLISARESITYNALVEAGINKNTVLCADPALLLSPSAPPPHDGFELGNTVGINLSPLVQNLEKGGNITLNNAFKLAEYILNCTDMNIALIPHVTWDYTDDRQILAALYERFKHTGRIKFFDAEHDCSALKAIIAKCRFMGAARTHASIAAYSSCVPTLVIGYSVKARGIARDIFGSWQNYVLPVQNLRQEDEFTRAFKFIYANEAAIKEQYSAFMAQYKQNAARAAQEIEKL